MSTSTRAAGRAALLARMKGPAPLDNTPKNRAQRRQAARALRRLDQPTKTRGG